MLHDCNVQRREHAIEHTAICIATYRKTRCYVLPIEFMQFCRLTYPTDIVCYTRVMKNLLITIHQCVIYSLQNCDVFILEFSYRS